MNKRTDLQTENKSLRSQIKSLGQKNASLSRGIVRLKNYGRVIAKQLEDAENNLKTERQRRKDAEASLKRSNRELRDKTGKLEKAEKELADTTAKLDEVKKQAAELAEQVAKLENQETVESRGNSVPPSHNPTGRKKRHVIVNNQTDGAGERKRGGQPGHPRATLQGFDKKEATEEETVESTVVPGTLCPDQCPACKKTFKTPFRVNEDQSVSYGPWVKTEMIMNIVENHMSYSQACEHITEMTDGKVAPCPGYASKLIGTYARLLRKSGFADDLRIGTICHDLVYWDDTGVSINGNQGCMRVYTTKDTVFYVCHRHKDTIGLDVDGILQYLDETQCVMHDHCKINYNLRYWYKNLDCVHHFQRKMVFVFCSAGFQCAIDLKMLIGNITHERKELLKAGKNSFSKETEERYLDEIRSLLEKGKALIMSEGKEETKHYYYNDVVADFNLGLDHFEQYFGWIRDFSLPPDNSISERLLRPIKSKMKQSGCFYSDETGDDYALIRSYIDTCAKNGKTKREAVYRLCMGKPYSLTELVPAESLPGFEDLKQEILEAEEKARTEMQGSKKQSSKEKDPKKEHGKDVDSDEAPEDKAAQKNSAEGQDSEEKGKDTDAGNEGKGKNENGSTGDNVDTGGDAMGHEVQCNDGENKRELENPERDAGPAHSQTGFGKTCDKGRTSGKSGPDKAEADQEGDAGCVDAVDQETEGITNPTVPRGRDDALPATEPMDGSAPGQATSELEEDENSEGIGTPPKGEVDHPLDDADDHSQAEPGEKTGESTMTGMGENTHSAPQPRAESAMGEASANTVLFANMLWEDITPYEQSRKAPEKEEVRRDANGRKMTATQEQERATTTRAERIKIGAQMKAQAEIDAKAQAAEDAQKDAQRREERRRQAARMRGECEAAGARALGSDPGEPKPDKVPAPECQRYMV